MKTPRANATVTRRKRIPAPLGYVIYAGPSRIDGAPIVCIVTGVRTESTNAKTGAMLQVYFLRADVDPREAIKNGADASICGGCTHRRRAVVITKKNGTTVTRFARTCYVNIGQGPTTVYKAFRRGAYMDATTWTPDMLATIGRGRLVRLGTYGDPASIAVDRLRALVSQSAGWTGYTHQWKAERLRDTLALCVASCDSAADVVRAREFGAGTFRVTPVGGEPLAGEIRCPASAEAGKVTTCADCRMCAGPNALNVVIAAHGSSRNFVGAQPARRALVVIN